MVKVYIENKISKVTGAADFREKLEDALSYRTKGFQFTDAYARGDWDGRRLLLWNGVAFPTGLAGLVIETLNREGVEVQVYDQRSVPKRGPELVFLGEDRPYQRIEDQCIAATRGIINFATGGGKTAVAARIIAKLDVPTLFIVPTKELLHQTAEELNRFLGVTVGKIGDKHFDLDYFTVATIQALFVILKNKNHKRRGLLEIMMDETDVVFVDEAHHLGADSFFHVAQAVPAYYKFGLTGTAFRNDNADLLLRAATGKVIARVSSSELIRADILARTKVRMHSFRSTELPDGMEWKDVYYYGVVWSQPRNALIRDLATDRIRAGKLVLIMVQRIEHGHILGAALEREGSVFVQGRDSSQFRENLRLAFRSGEVRCVIATNIYDEGVDIPAMDTLIIASGGMSPVKSTQRVGRALRRTSDKTEAEIIDFMDDHHRILRRHANRRLRTYRSEPEFDVEVIRG